MRCAKAKMEQLVEHRDFASAGALDKWFHGVRTEVERYIAQFEWNNASQCLKEAQQINSATATATGGDGWDRPAPYTHKQQEARAAAMEAEEMAQSMGPA